MFKITYFFLSQLERELIEKQIILSNPGLDLEEILLLDDREIVKCKQRMGH